VHLKFWKSGNRIERVESSKAKALVHLVGSFVRKPKNQEATRQRVKLGRLSQEPLLTEGEAASLIILTNSSLLSENSRNCLHRCKTSRNTAIKDCLKTHHLAGAAC
jgi:hypothetical protein